MTIEQARQIAASTLDELNALKPGPAEVYLTWANIGRKEHFGTIRAAQIAAIVSQNPALVWFDKALAVGMDIADPQAVAVLPPLVAGSVITQAEADAILSWGGWQSDAQRILGRPATDQDLADAAAIVALEAARDAKRAEIDALSPAIDAALVKMQGVREAAIVALNNAETLDAVTTVVVPTLADALSAATE